MDLMGEFNSDDHHIYYCGQESLGRNGVAIIVNERVWNAVLGCNLKNNRISVHFQGKPFNITVIQVYVPKTNAEDWSWTILWRPTRPSRTNTKKRCICIIGGWNAKVGSQEIPGVTGKFGFGVQNEAGQRLTEFWQDNVLVIANTLFQQHKTLHMDFTRRSTPKSDWLYSLQSKMEMLYTVSKSNTGS